MFMSDSYADNYVEQGSVSLSIAEDAYNVAFYIAVDDGTSGLFHPTSLHS